MVQSFVKLPNGTCPFLALRPPPSLTSVPCNLPVRRPPLIESLASNWACDALNFSMKRATQVQCSSVHKPLTLWPSKNEKALPVVHLSTTFEGTHTLARIICLLPINKYTVQICSLLLVLLLGRVSKVAQQIHHQKERCVIGHLRGTFLCLLLWSAGAQCCIR